MYRLIPDNTCDGCGLQALTVYVAVDEATDHGAELCECCAQGVAPKDAPSPRRVYEMKVRS